MPVKHIHFDFTKAIQDAWRDAQRQAPSTWRPPVKRDPKEDGSLSPEQRTILRDMK